MLATLQLRAIGLAGLANTIAESRRKPSPPIGRAPARQQAQLLSASDVVWAELFKLPATDTLKKLGINGVIAPASQIVTNPDLITAHSFDDRLPAPELELHEPGGGTGSGVHGSTLVGTTARRAAQTKTLSPSSPTTVDVSADLVFDVAFQNSGDYPEVQIPVTLTVNVCDKQVVTKTKKVAQIASAGDGPSRSRTSSCRRPRSARTPR